MALQLTSDDDKEVENIKSDGSKKTETSLGKSNLCIEIEKLYTQEEVTKILNHYQKMSLSELDIDVLNKYYLSRNGKVDNNK